MLSFFVKKSKMKLSGLSFFFRTRAKTVKVKSRTSTLSLPQIESSLSLNSVLCRTVSWDDSEDVFPSFIGYYELPGESGANFVPQNTSSEPSTVQFDTIPTQSFASSQNTNPVLESVLL